MDMTESIAPKSDQMNASDLITGPQTFTIEKVTLGSAEQPFCFHMTGLPGRPYKPNKSMRRVMVAIWGKDPEQYIGRSLTLFNNPAVTWAGEEVGGIQISHMSQMKREWKGSLAVSKKKKALHVVQPLVESAPASAVQVTPERVAESMSVDELRSLWSQASPDVQALIQARVAELQAVQGG